MGYATIQGYKRNAAQVYQEHDACVIGVYYRYLSQ
jgi:hypothetical protein